MHLNGVMSIIVGTKLSHPICHINGLFGILFGVFQCSLTLWGIFISRHVEVNFSI